MRSPPPDRLVAVLGTSTAVGKTWVTAAVVRALRAGGVAAVARKPVQSFGPAEAAATDAHVLAAAGDERPEDVCPRHRWYEAAMAPPMAAAALGRPPFTVADLVAELAWPAPTAVGLVETVGGPRSPVADDGESIDLAAAVRPQLVLLVAEAGLGAINAVRISVPVVAGMAMVAFLNRFDGGALHRANRAWLEGDGIDVVTEVAALVARLRPGAG